MKKLIYIVEDEENIKELYECALNTNFEVKTFENGTDMISALNSRTPDLFILDIMLPIMSGGKILEYLKQSGYSDIPVIMVSAKGDEVSKVKHLDMGADDYITKPFGIMELSARINANLRKKTSTINKIEGVELNESIFAINVDGINYKTTLKEFELLKYLMSNYGKVCKRDDILNGVWGIEFDCESRTLDMHIKTIREKLECSKLEIQTIRGVGYLLKKKE
jgi:two-component system alkaline phosphatase synthesis response regulator PhoP